MENTFTVVMLVIYAKVKHLGSGSHSHTGPVHVLLLETAASLRGQNYHWRKQALCDVYVGSKVRVSEFMIFLTLQHCGSK